VKNIHHAVRLLKDLEGQIELDIYGPIEDLTYWEKCKEEIKKIKNKRIVIAYKGTVKDEDIYDVLKKYHFLYFMATTENFGYIIYEALSMGCPTLISDRTLWQDLEVYKAGWIFAIAFSFKRTMTFRKRMVSFFCREWTSHFILFCCV
jgi:glycosyltransferase involved in cell wall biosynthesis